MKDIVKDYRGAAVSVAAVFAIIGYVVLVGIGQAAEGEHLLETVGLPALTFLIGFGSDPKDPTPEGE